MNRTLLYPLGVTLVLFALVIALCAAPLAFAGRLSTRFFRFTA